MQEELLLELHSSKQDANRQSSVETPKVDAKGSRNVLSNQKLA